MKKITKLSCFTLSLCLLFFSCTEENHNDSAEIQEQEQELRTALGIKTNLLSNQEKERIVNTTEPIFFSNIQAAKNFIDGVSKPFKYNFTGEQIKYQIKNSGYNRKGRDFTINFDDGFLLSVPCSSYVLDPYDGCEEDGGGSSQNCGSGNVRLRSGNNSLSFYYNATFNYNSQNGTVNASSFNSYTSGITLGTSYQQISSNHWVATNGTINFTIRGVLNYNIFVDGVGTVFTESITLKGNYNPCNSVSGGLELFLEPAN